MPEPVAEPRWIEVEAPLLVSRIVERELGVEGEAARSLLELGAVYWNRRRLREDRLVSAGDWVKVHPEPRRFPLPPGSPLDRIVAEEEDCFVVDKPSGLPIHPTCDNATDNLLSWMERGLGRPLWICQRLDIGTQGLVVLGKDRDFRIRFSRWLEERRVEKRYRALIPIELPLGELVHWMADASRAPYRVDPLPSEGSRECRLTVEAVRPWEDLFEGEIRLGTGRHHQIRCQLAALGAPIVGDSLYGSARAVPDGLGAGERFALQACELGLPDGRAFAIKAPWGLPSSRTSRERS